MSTNDAARSGDASYDGHIVAEQTRYGLPKSRDEALSLADQSTLASISKEFKTDYRVKFEDQPAVALGTEPALALLHQREAEADEKIKQKEIEARARLEEAIWREEQLKLALEREAAMPEEEQKLANRARAQEFVDTVQSIVNDGEIPSTYKVTSALDVAQSSSVWSEVAEKPLSTAGKKLMENAERLIDSTKKVLEEKNYNDQFQTMLKHGAIAAEEAQERSSLYDSISSTFGEDKSITMQTEDMTQKAVNAVRLLISSTNFRALMRDFISLLNSAVAEYVPEIDEHRTASGKFEAVANAGTKAIKEKIEDVEDGKSAKELAKDTVESTKQNLKKTMDSTKSTAKSMKEDIKEGVKKVTDSAKDVKEDVKEGIKKTTDSAKKNDKESVKKDVKDTVKSVKDGANKAADSLKKDDKESLTQNVKDTAESIKDNVKETAQSAKETVKEAVKDFKLPEKERDEIVHRFRALMQDMQKNEQYQGAVSDLLDVLSSVYFKASMVLSSVESEVVEPLTESRHADIALHNAKELLENFSNGAPLDPLGHAIEDFVQQVKDNESINKYMDDLRVFLVQTLRSPTFLTSTDMSNQAAKLVDTGRELIGDTLHENVQLITNEAETFLSHLTEDSTTTEFGENLKNLMSDLFLDDRGKPTFKAELVNDFAKIIPVVMDKLQYFPIPRFEYSDESYDFIFDNLTFNCLVAPRHVQVLTNTHYDTVSENMVNTITFRISRIQAAANNIVFYYNKKVFPRMSDVGVASFTIGEDGIDIDMTIQPEISEIIRDIKEHELPKNRVFKVLSVDSKVHDLKMTLKRTHHSWMYKLLNPFVHTIVRNQIQEALNKGLKELVFKVEDAVNLIAAKIDSASLDLSTLASTLSSGGKEE